MKAISLFSGMGGDSLAIRNCGIDLVAYSEISKIFQKTHEINFPDSKLIGDGDILKIKDEDFLKYKNSVNLIFAGFPCQGFSLAGKKNPDDPRNTLFKEFLRATRLVDPDYIIGENVKGLLKAKTPNDEYFINIIKQEFEKLGYNIYYKLMKTKLHGLPQNRERTIIVGIKKSLNKNYKFPEEQEQTVNLKNIVKFTMQNSIQIYEEDFDMNTIPKECILTDMNNDEEGNGIPHPNLKSLAKRRDYVYQGKNIPIRLTFGKRTPVSGEIIDIRKPINTITCTYSRQPRFFVPLKNKRGYFLRCLTINELKQIQGFPLDYKLNGNEKDQIIQIGNAVPPILIEKIIKSIIG